MRVQTFNDTASVEGKVQGGGPASPNQGEGSPKSGGLPKARQSEGTENLRANTVTSSAAIGETVGRSKAGTLAQSFEDSSV